MPRPLSKFAVRALLVIFTLGLTVLSFWLLFVFPIVRQHRIAEHLESNGAKVQWEVGGSPWVERYLGEYWCTEVVSVEMNNNAEARELMVWLPGLRSVHRVELAGNDLVDDDLRYLAGLTQLKILHIHDNKITDQGLSHLKKLSNLETLIHNEPVGKPGIDILSNLPSLRMNYLLVDQVTTQDLLKFPGLSEINELSIKRPIDDDWTKAFAVCQNLFAFRLAESSLSDQQLTAILQKEELRSLELTKVPVRNSILPILVDHAELHHLELVDTEVSYEQMLAQFGRQAATVFLFDDNISLMIEGTKTRRLYWQGKPQIEKLDVLKHCEQCVFLLIRGEKYHGCDLQVLPKMQALSGVRLEGPLSDDDLEDISKIPRLTTLTLTDPLQVTAKGLAYLQNASRLIDLALFETDLTDAHCKEIGKLKSLQELLLSDCKVTNPGIASLVDLQCLEELALFHCPQLDDAALPHIAKLNSLARLFFASVPITDEGLPCLYGMPNLDSVSLNGTKCTPEGEKKLEKKLPSYFYAYEFYP